MTGGGDKVRRALDEATATMRLARDVAFIDGRDGLDLTLMAATKLCREALSLPEREEWREETIRLLGDLHCWLHEQWVGMDRFMGEGSMARETHDMRDRVWEHWKRLRRLSAAPSPGAGEEWVMLPRHLTPRLAEAIAASILTSETVEHLWASVLAAEPEPREPLERYVPAGLSPSSGPATPKEPCQWCGAPTGWHQDNCPHSIAGGTLTGRSVKE